MKIHTSYSCQITQYRHIFKETVQIYRKAVDFFISICLQEWILFSDLQYQNESTTVMESLTITTARRPAVPYNFTRADKRFYKMPSYLRRAAIAEAYGKVCSYQSNLANWESSDPSTRGKRPSVPKAGYIYPALYKDNVYRDTSDPYVLEIKV